MVSLLACLTIAILNYFCAMVVVDILYYGTNLKTDIGNKDAADLLVAVTPQIRPLVVLIMCAK